jgi:hypothetical protein
MTIDGAWGVKPLTLVLCVALVAGIGVPAVGPPFADTPANPWAYEALARPAAKGLIQGYPDGTLKGDRTLTRYEMAMIVARVLEQERGASRALPGPHDGRRRPAGDLPGRAGR